jgi:hypothetical protein
VIRGHQPEDLTTLANHDPRIERQLGRERRAELGPADSFADDKGTGGADVDGIEVIQLPDKRCRTESSVPADVYSSEKYHQRHKFAPDWGCRTTASPRAWRGTKGKIWSLRILKARHY